MPKGTRHDLEGLLLRDARGYMVLRVDDGGEWRLNANRKTADLIGNRVRVLGVRSGFDILEVTSITLTKS